MVERITSGRVGQASGFDPMASQRQGARVAQGLGQAANELSRLGGRVEDDLQRGADFFNRTEGMRRQREIAGDLAGIEETVVESGAGYADAGMSALKQRQSESLARAGNDPRKREALERQFQIENERYQLEFEKGERDWGDAYSNYEFLRGLDDSTQRTSRGSYVAPVQYGNGGFKAGLGHTESGGNYRAKNSEGFTGKYQFGQDRLDDYARAVGIDQIDIEAYRKNDALQEQIMDWHIDDIDGFIDQKGLDRSIGRTVKGVVMTRDGMRAMAHLGGKDGMRRFLASNGEYDPADSNGTKLSDYARTHGSDGFGIPQYNGPLPDLSKNQEFQDELQAQYATIDAMPIKSIEKRQLRDQALNQLTAAAVQNMAQVNPAAALAYLRSGAADEALNFKQTGGLEDALVQQQKSLLETQIAAQAKAQAAEFKSTANDAADNFIASQVTEQEAPALSPDQMAVLSREKRIAVEDAPHVATARALGESAEPQDLAGIRKQITDTVEPARAQKMLAEFDRVANPRIDRARNEAAFDMAVSAGMSPNMGDKDQRQVAEDRFADAVGVGGFEAAGQFVLENRAAPDGFGEVVAMALGGNDPAARREAVETVGRIHSADPRILANAKGAAIDRALAINEYLLQGVSQEQAEQLSADLSNPTNSAAIDARRKMWTTDKGAMAEDAWDRMQDSIQERSGGGLFSRAAQIPEEVQAEYSDLARDFFASTGNMDVAVTLATRSFFATHSITSVGGVPAWQKGAPESVPAYRVYGDDRDTAYIESQAISEAQAALKDVGKVEEITLIPNGEVTRNSEPSYSIAALVGDTVELLPMPFKPDHNAERLKADTENTKAVSAQKANFAYLDLVNQRSRLTDLAMTTEDPVELQKITQEIIRLRPELSKAQKEVAATTKKLLKDTAKPIVPAHRQNSSEFKGRGAAVTGG